jgi:hypothetical protein
MNNKYNNTAITLSASSAKSTTSSASSHSAMSNSYFGINKLAQDESNLMMLGGSNLSSQKLLSSSSSASASPDDRMSSLSSSASSTSSESNYHDCSLATLKSVMKNSESNQNIMTNSMLSHQHQQSNTHNLPSGNNLAVGSSTRSQLRRSKMIYHCKFGKLNI